MIRLIACVAAVVGLIVGLALIDRDREPEAIATALAPPPAPAATAAAASIAPDDGLSFGDTAYLTSCLSSALTGAGDAPPAPPLSPRGVKVISERIERLRELRFDGAVDAEFLDDAELDQRISGLIDRDYPASLARRQGAVLELLGAIPPDSDLLALTETALASQVIGLFVPETEELLVSSSGKAGALEEITLAHELEHALATDALGLPLPERTRAGRSDRDLAAQALVEGDATLTMELYALRHVDLGEQLSILDEPGVAGGDPGLKELPYFLRRQLLFPYDAGLKFVCERYTSGGWDAVDRAYDDPPRSTAELLDPQAATTGFADPPPPGSLPAPWRRTLAGQLGAAELTWLFEAPGGDSARALPDPAVAAHDWLGGRYVLWQSGRESALGVSISEREGGSLCGAMLAWYGASVPDSVLEEQDAGARTFEAPEQSAVIACVDPEIRIGIGPDPAVAEALAG